MRIGLLTEYPLSHRAGWQSTVRRIREALEKRGHEIVLLHEAPDPHRAWKFLRRLRGKVGRTHLNEEQVRRGAAQADLRAQSVDLILSVMGSRLLAAMRSDRPAVYVTDATGKRLRAEYPAHRAQPKPSHAVEESVMARCALHVYSSEWARRSAIEEYGIDPAQAAVIPLGANLEPEPDCAPDPPAPAPCQLLFVGSDWERKNGAACFDILAELQRRGVDARLQLVGQPAPEIPPQLADCVDHLGWLEVERAADARRYREAYRSSHFLLLPTQADCTPIVCAEASAFGLPTIAPEVGGLSAMVETGSNGVLLAREATPADYARCIEDLWRDQERYRALRASSARRHRELLNWDAWAAAIEPILQRARQTRAA